MDSPNTLNPLPPSSRRSEITEDIIVSAVVLGLLYLGRDVLMPITLAVILSLALLPLVRRLKHFGLGQTSAVLVSVSVLTTFIAGLAIVIGVQMVHVATSLPQYEATIQAKIKSLRALSVDHMVVVQSEAGRMFGGLEGQSRDEPVARGRVGQGSGVAAPPMRVEIQEPRESPHKVITSFLSSLWKPLETTGIVLVVLVFVLLEHATLRDRLIRLAGSADLRATTTAINDAGERLSRYFAAQFAVNFGVGVTVWIGLIALGFPQAMLWATLTAALRFVPYVGTVLAAVSAAVFAAAVVPGWELMILVVALYVVVETIVGQVIEPMLYGHTTGLSPLAVVVGAIVWTWLWGPVGLIVSTPLTLCLLVAGRHVKALAFLDILLGDAHALTMPQRFYQRALSGDADEIIAAARSFLKHKTFASYCDKVLMRAMQLASHDVMVGILSQQEELKVRDAILTVIETLDRETTKRSHKLRREPVLDDANLGLHLRHWREAISGHWQGPLSVPDGTVVLGVGLGALSDDFATEILVRVLRDLHIDARNISIEEFEKPPPSGSEPAIVAMVYIVGISSEHEQEKYAQAAEQVRRWLPQTPIAVMLLPGLLPSDARVPLDNLEVDLVVTSFEQAAQMAGSRVPHGSPMLMPA